MAAVLRGKKTQSEKEFEVKFLSEMFPKVDLDIILDVYLEFDSNMEDCMEKLTELSGRSMEPVTENSTKIDLAIIACSLLSAESQPVNVSCVEVYDGPDDEPNSGNNLGSAPILPPPGYQGVQPDHGENLSNDLGCVSSSANVILAPQVSGNHPVNNPSSVVGAFGLHDNNIASVTKSVNKLNSLVGQRNDNLDNYVNSDIIDSSNALNNANILNGQHTGMANFFNPASFMFNSSSSSLENNFSNCVNVAANPKFATAKSDLELYNFNTGTYKNNANPPNLYSYNEGTKFQNFSTKNIKRFSDNQQLNSSDSRVNRDMVLSDLFKKADSSSKLSHVWDTFYNSVESGLFNAYFKTSNGEDANEHALDSSRENNVRNGPKLNMTQSEGTSCIKNNTNTAQPVHQTVDSSFAGYGSEAFWHPGTARVSPGSNIVTPPPGFSTPVGNSMPSTAKLSPNALEFIPRPLANHQFKVAAQNHTNCAQSYSNVKNQVPDKLRRANSSAKTFTRTKGKEHLKKSQENIVKNIMFQAQLNKFHDQLTSFDYTAVREDTAKDFDPIDPLGWNNLFSTAAPVPANAKSHESKREKKLSNDMSDLTTKTSSVSTSLSGDNQNIDQQFYSISNPKLKVRLLPADNGSAATSPLPGITMKSENLSDVRSSLPSPVNELVQGSPNEPPIAHRLLSSLQGKAVLPTGQPDTSSVSKTLLPRLPGSATISQTEVIPTVPRVEENSAPLAHILQNKLQFRGVRTPVGVLRRYILEQKPVLVILRGLPGSGKSYLARQLFMESQNLGGQGHILSTDDYFLETGQYLFSRAELSEAHNWNKRRTLLLMKEGMSPLIIDNTNTTLWEMLPYAILALEHGYDVQLFEPDTPWRKKVNDLTRKNTHNVKKEAIKKMKERWEHISLEDVLKQASYSLANRKPPTCDQNKSTVTQSFPVKERNSDADVPNFSKEISSSTGQNPKKSKGRKGAPPPSQVFNTGNSNVTSSNNSPLISVSAPQQVTSSIELSVPVTVESGKLSPKTRQSNSKGQSPRKVSPPGLILSDWFVAQAQRSPRKKKKKQKSPEPTEENQRTEITLEYLNQSLVEATNRLSLSRSHENNVVDCSVATIFSEVLTSPIGVEEGPVTNFLTTENQSLLDIENDMNIHGKEAVEDAKYCQNQESETRQEPLPGTNGHLNVQSASFVEDNRCHERGLSGPPFSVSLLDVDQLNDFAGDLINNQPGFIVVPGGHKQDIEDSSSFAENLVVNAVSPCTVVSSASDSSSYHTVNDGVSLENNEPCLEGSLVDKSNIHDIDDVQFLTENEQLVLEELKAQPKDVNDSKDLDSLKPMCKAVDVVEGDIDLKLDSLDCGKLEAFRGDEHEQTHSNNRKSSPGYDTISSSEECKIFECKASFPETDYSTYSTNPLCYAGKEILNSEIMSCEFPVSDSHLAVSSDPSIKTQTLPCLDTAVDTTRDDNMTPQVKIDNDYSADLPSLIPLVEYSDTDDSDQEPSLPNYELTSDLNLQANEYVRHKPGKGHSEHPAVLISDRTNPAVEVDLSDKSDISCDKSTQNSVSASSSREQSPLDEDCLGITENSQSTNKKKKRIRKGRNTGPFIEDSLKIKSRTQNWSSFVVQSAESFDSSEDSVLAEHEIAPLETNSSASQTDPYYFSIVYKLNSPAFMSLQPVDLSYTQVKVLFSIVSHQYDGVKALSDVDVMQNRKPYNRVDRSTTTDETLEKEEIDLATLQSCFPEYSRKQLETTLAICQNDIEWVTNHLLDSPALYDVENEDEVDNEEDTKSDEVKLRNQNLDSGKLKAGVKSLAEICTAVVKQTSEVDADDLEMQTIRVGEERLHKIELFGRLRVHSLSYEDTGNQHRWSDEIGLHDFLLARSPSKETAAKPSNFWRSHSLSNSHSVSLSTTKQDDDSLLDFHKEMTQGPSRQLNLTTDGPEESFQHDSFKPEPRVKALEAELDVLEPKATAGSSFLQCQPVVPMELVQHLESLYGPLFIEIDEAGLALDDSIARKIYNCLKLQATKHILKNSPTSKPAVAPPPSPGSQQLQGDEALARALQAQENISSFKTAKGQDYQLSVNKGAVPGWTDSHPSWMSSGIRSDDANGSIKTSEASRPIRPHSVADTLRLLRGEPDKSMGKRRGRRTPQQLMGQVNVKSVWFNARRKSPVDSLISIMEEEMAREQQQREQLRIIESEDDMEALATRIKRVELSHLFPSMGADILEDIFRSTGYSKEETIKVLQHSYNIFPVPISKDKQDFLNQLRKNQEEFHLVEEEFDDNFPSDDSEDSYESLRSEARIYRQLFVDCQQQAQRYYSSGMQGAALFYRQRAKKYKEEEKAANSRAAQVLFEKGSVRLQQENTLDLHFYHLEEAISAVNTAIEMKEEEYRKKPDKKNSYLDVVTGWGRNSKNGKPRLKPAIINHLYTRSFQYEERSPGMIRVYLQKR